MVAAWSDEEDEDVHGDTAMHTFFFSILGYSAEEHALLFDHHRCFESIIFGVGATANDALIYAMYDFVGQLWVTHDMRRAELFVDCIDTPHDRADHADFFRIVPSPYSPDTMEEMFRDVNTRPCFITVTDYNSDNALITILP